MKYKPKFLVKTSVNKNEGSRTTEEQPRPTKPSYTQALTSNTNTFEKVKSIKQPRKQDQQKYKRKIKITHSSKSKTKTRDYSVKNNSKTDLSLNYKY